MPVNKFGRNPRTNNAAAAHTTIRIVETLNKDEDFILNVGTDTNRTLGCEDLTDGKTFTLSLGDEQNKIIHTKGRCIQLITSDNLEISSSNNNSLFKIGELDGFAIKNLPDPTNDSDAATMGYVKLMTSEQTTLEHRIVEGFIPNAPYTNIILMQVDQQHPTTMNIYVECVNEEWMDVTCAGFVEYFKNFKLFIDTENNNLICNFTSTGSAVGTSRKYKIICI
jgi:hypothetical protein